jgi:adenosine deaminase/adenosine deaminase CECR1
MFVHAGPKAAKNKNEIATARHFASLLAGPAPKLAELSLFFTQMPKGGDLHHHYSGALYAEQYLHWVDQAGYCIDKTSYRIATTDKAIAAGREGTPATRTCMTGSEVLLNDGVLAELLQRWSSKDFYNHSGIQSPPDRQFFDTFAYFSAPSNLNYNEGLLALKRRAIAENLSYIETMFKMTEPRLNADFDSRIQQAGSDDTLLNAHFRAMLSQLEQDPSFNQSVQDYIAKVETSSAKVDDEQFTMRYQTYVLRLLAPSQVFSSMVGGFKAASLSPLIVGVNIVGQESNTVAMRDYSLHMKMFKFLKSQYPAVKLALHAGELALGMVPPEGLQFHIDEAINVAGAERIGHGMDLAHEAQAPALLRRLREKNIAVEVNLTSNEFILGIKGQAHPVSLYRQYGVPFVLATDDAGVSRNNLSNEYLLFATRYHPDYAEIKKLSYNGLRYAFLPAKEKTRLIQQLDARFHQFEAEMAAMKR